MHVRHRHEYRNHQSAVMKVFIFFHFLNHHDFTVGSSHHCTFRIFLEQADGAAEKIDCNGIYGDADGSHHVERQQAHIL